MPKPLGPEPDSVPIHEQVRILMRKAHEDRMAPVGIVFSREGFNKARAQTVPGMDPWGAGNRGQHGPQAYLGLPFTVSTSLTTGDVLLDLVPGGSAEAKAFRDGKRAMRADHDYPVPYREPVRITTPRQEATEAIDPTTKRPVGDHGTASQAMDYALAGDNEVWTQEVEFLQAWREGRAAEEWPEFYEWLNEQEDD